MTAPNTFSNVSTYKAILWDNDGVLVDTERFYFQASREAFAEAGLDLTMEHFFDYFLSSSSGTSRFGAAHGLSETEIATVQETRNKRYQQLLEQEEIIIDGVREILEMLRHHFVMGIVTSSRRQHFETIHARTGLLELFEFAITREDYPHNKPAPDPYLAAVARTGFAVDRCLAIEDTPRGITAARAASIDCFAIPTDLTRKASFSGATRVLNSIADVATLLLDGRQTM